MSTSLNVYLSFIPGLNISALNLKPYKFKNIKFKNLNFKKVSNKINKNYSITIEKYSLSFKNN